MDIHSRIARLQQVMSQFALTCPRDESLKLSSSMNYPKWNSYTAMLVATQGAGLDIYFATGDLMLSPTEPIDENLMVQLRVALNSAIQVVLLNTVSSKVLLKYQSDNVFGFDLLLLIRRDYSHVTSRQLYAMVNKACDASVSKSAGDESALSLFRDICAHFNHSSEITQVMGLFYLRMFRSDQANARVLDVSNPNITLSAVENTLRDLVPTTQGSVFAATSKKPYVNRQKCYRCQKRGHVAKDCPATAPVAANNSSGNTVALVNSSSKSISGISWAVFNSREGSVVPSPSYILDSGATLHISNERSHFAKFTPASGCITGISSNPLVVKGTGTIRFVHPVSSKVLTVSDVCFVPDATQNLISIKKASKSGSFTFSHEAVHYLSSSDETASKIATACGPDLYEFDYTPVVGDALAVPNAISHAALGHPPPAVMTQMGVPCGPKMVECSSCAAGKMTQIFPKQASSPRTKAPLQLIHADVCGPFPIPGFAAEKYFLTIVDDFSRWSQIIPLNTKAETNAYFKNFILTAENHFSSRGLKVSQVRTDNGTEFDNKEINQFYFEKGISHQLTVPYNSSQNGVAERKHRTIKEKARVLLHSSGLPSSFWSEAVKTAEFLINRYPSSLLNGDSPFFRWYGYEPLYSVFHPFGVQCHVLIPPAKRTSAFSPVSSEAIFVGYSPVHKAYRCYVPALKDVIISNNVKFNDSVFPCLKSPTVLDVDSSNSLPSDILFGTSAPGAYLPSPTDSSQGSVYGPLSVPTHGDTLREVISRRPSSVIDPSVSATDFVSSSGDSVETTEHEDPLAECNLPHLTSTDAPKPEACVLLSEESPDHLTDNMDFAPNEVLKLPDISTTTFDYQEPDRAIALVDISAENHAGVPSDEDHAVVSSEPNFPSASLLDCVPDEIPSVVPVLNPLPRVSSQLSISSVESDTDLLGLIPDDTPSDASENKESKELSIAPDLTSGPALVRTISEVTDFDGPIPKRADHHTAMLVSGQVFHAIHAVHRAYVTTSSASYIPSTIQEALASPDSAAWIQAINKELDAHRENATWTLTSLPAGRRAIGCRWVFTIKDNTTPPTYKARLVAQGFRQVHGLDYGETFSPVVRYESIRVLFALAARFDLVIHQMDVTTAFLNGDLHEEIYMQPPPGSPAAGSKVCHLNKSLYGLKQAPLCWNVKINQVLLDFGFVRSMSEFGVYSLVIEGSVTLVALYVDDLLILSNTPTSIDSVKDVLASNFRMKDLGLVSRFLGMQVTQRPGIVSMHLGQYLTGFLGEFNMSDCNSVQTPLAAGASLVPNGKPLPDADASLYRSMVGKLLFAANTVRPDLAYAASALSRFIKTPYPNHQAAAKHVLRYIKGTIGLGLVFKKSSSFNLTGYCDSDWAGDKADRKSITGYVFMLGNSAVTWKSTKQQTVALSSTEAEYMALSDAVKELLWLKQLLKHIGLKLNRVPCIFEDNEGCRMLSAHPVHHQRTKHIDIKHHFVRHHISERNCEIVSISTDNMVADMLTKSLSKIKFNKFVKLAGMINVSAGV